MKPHSPAVLAFLSVEQERRASFLALLEAYRTHRGECDAEAKHREVSARYEAARAIAYTDCRTTGDLWS